MDAAMLARMQFAFTIAYHFFFVPFSIGLGLFMAIAETRFYRKKDELDGAVAKLIMKIFTATFVVGVATGITMEFAFGTNWATYSRFVGDIFGAPLAAEALFAFFLESVFLGVLLFGRKKVSPKFYCVSAWLVFAGSCLSALWILIANSWMQTPAGYTVVDTGSGLKAQMTDFFAAAFNPSLAGRYFHTVDAVLVCGAFVMIAIAGYYLLKHKDMKIVKRFLGVGLVVGVITVCLQVPFGHLSAINVAEYQPTKLAALEGHYEDGPLGMSVAGYVDEENHVTFSIDVPIAGMTSWLASGDFNTSYPGLNSYDSADIPPVNFTFQAYHIMIIMFGFMLLFLLLGFLVYKKPSLQKKKWPSRLLMFSPLTAIFAIQFGWAVAEVGRQPWIVWEELRTSDAISASVDATQICITLALFFVVYLIIFIAWARVVSGAIKKGPVLEGGSAGPHDGSDTGAAAIAAADASAEQADAAPVSAEEKGGE